MIYEIRTYTLRTGAVPEFEERYEKRCLQGLQGRCCFCGNRCHDFLRRAVFCKDS